MAGLDDYTGTFNDKLFEFLGDEGLTGTLNDRLDKYTGLDSILSDPNVDQKLQYIYLNGVPVSASSALLLNTGDYLLLNTGDKLLLNVT